MNHTGAHREVIVPRPMSKALASVLAKVAKVQPGSFTEVTPDELRAYAAHTKAQLVSVPKNEPRRG